MTAPEYYSDEDGRDRAELEPRRGFGARGWWTCDPRTRAGDLVLLYRARVRKDLARLLVARSDAEVLDLPDSEFDGRSVCSYEVLESFDRPVPFATISRDPFLGAWGPVRLRLQGSSFPVPQDMWARLLDLAGEDGGDVADQALDGLRRFRLEKELQRRLASRTDLWDDARWRGLRLVESEYRFPDRRRADLLFEQYTGWRRRLVVVEVKRGRVDLEAVEQVLGYREALDKGVARQHLRRPQAILVGESLHDEARARIARTSGLHFLSSDHFDALRRSA
ncbi:endonuclease NucS domain-containing protein [Actinomycetospora sp. NBC_00405]|uniref:endonuclease NucS domain-containing protein n=1 Tax=Actinomycetospora sp. NBC_00405 TaxID=2975952 RepID=UPI002E1FF028